MVSNEWQKKFLDCFTDLQRAAVAFYLNPRGETHQVFLRHSQKVLREVENRPAREFSLKLRNLERKTALPPKSKRKIANLADEILTVGLLVKSKAMA